MGGCGKYKGVKGAEMGKWGEGIGGNREGGGGGVIAKDRNG